MLSSACWEPRCLSNYFLPQNYLRCAYLLLVNLQQLRTQAHYATARCILLYLHDIITHAIFLSSSSQILLRAYSNADWAVTSQIDTLPQAIALSRLIDHLFNERPARRTSFNIKCWSWVHAMTNPTVEMVWLQHLLLDMGVFIDMSTPLYYDKWHTTERFSSLIKPPSMIHHEFENILLYPRIGHMYLGLTRGI